MYGAYMTCMVMSGNGVLIGMILTTIINHHERIPLDRGKQWAWTVYCVAVPGSTMPGGAGRPAGTPAIRLTVSTSSASASPEVNRRRSRWKEQQRPSRSVGCGRAEPAQAEREAIPPRLPERAFKSVVSRIYSCLFFLLFKLFSILPLCSLWWNFFSATTI